MSKLVENYIAVNEGRMAKAEFLRQARQSLPGYINQFTSFEDAVQIFKNKGILTEEVAAVSEDCFPLETIEKGIEYELALAGVEDLDRPTSTEYRKAKAKVLENLAKDSLYYFYKMSSPENKKIAAAEKKNLQEAATEDDVRLNKAFLELYIKYKDGNYKIRDKESGELKDGKSLAPETAAQKACLRVRQAYNAPRFRPNRDTIRSCSTGRGSLQYQGEVDKIPRFNYSWSLKEAAWTEYSKDPVYIQFFQHYLKKAKEAKDVNAEKTARNQAKKAFLKYKEKHENMQESKKVEQNLLKEAISNSIVRILAEAATSNLAQLSDQNASIQEVPAILNNFENVVTEIESFILKEQQKIQGLFDSIGNIKNEDNIPIGYKFVEPIMIAFKKDLEPVLAKISLDNINLPEAPVTDSEDDLLNQPAAEEQPEEKQTVFSPASSREEKEPLAESKRGRGRYTKL